MILPHTVPKKHPGAGIMCVENQLVTVFFRARPESLPKARRDAETPGVFTADWEWFSVAISSPDLGLILLVPGQSTAPILAAFAHQISRNKKSWALLYDVSRETLAQNEQAVAVLERGVLGGGAGNNREPVLLSGNGTKDALWGFENRPIIHMRADLAMFHVKHRPFSGYGDGDAEDCL